MSGALPNAMKIPVNGYIFSCDNVTSFDLWRLVILRGTAMLNMKNLWSKEQHGLIVVYIVGAVWFFSLFQVVWWGDGFQMWIINIFILQLLLTTLYTDYKVASVKRELLRELGEGSSVPDSTEPKTAMKYLIHKAIRLVIVGVVLGIIWYMVHKLMISLESF